MTPPPLAVTLLCGLLLFVGLHITHSQMDESPDDSNLPNFLKSGKFAALRNRKTETKSTGTTSHYKGMKTQESEKLVHPSSDYTQNPHSVKTMGRKSMGGGTKSTSSKYSTAKTSGSYSSSSSYSSSKSSGKGGMVFPSSTSYGSTYLGGCNDKPHNAMNARMRCSTYSGCEVDCMPDYAFPNGQTQMSLQCENSEWVLVGAEWPELPDCEPVCKPACENDGICLAPGRCRCSEAYEGSHCEKRRPKPCVGIPPLPTNSRMSCAGSSSTNSHCTATCVTNDYLFPSGHSKISITCDDGRWVIEGHEEGQVPRCEPVCLVPCQNDGKCVAPNQCHCIGEYYGPQCQSVKEKPCLDKPPVPMNSRVKCSQSACVATCNANHQFPDGSSQAVFKCKDGSWLPEHRGVFEVPDCQPICDPPCVNGGRCLSLNQCQCPSDYRGPQCQYLSSSCSASNLHFNGGYNCSGKGDEYTCSIWCPSEVYFEFTPAAIYSCDYATGTFEPYPLPQCVFPSDVIILLPSSSSNQSYHETHYTSSKGSSKGGHKVPHTMGETIEVLQVQPQSGVCATWAKHHFLSFDGLLFSFESDCSYILLNDAYLSTFSIILDQSHDLIKVFLEGDEYFLKQPESLYGKPIITWRGSSVVVPSQLNGVIFEMASHILLMQAVAFGFTLRWNTRSQLLEIEASESLWNKTGGLCGRMDGNIEDELEKKDGGLTKNLLSFVDSWQADGINELCDSQPSDQSSCRNNAEKAKKAAQFCSQLLNDNKYATCRELIDVIPFYESCLWDHCSCEDDATATCGCVSVAAYFQACHRKGGNVEGTWRTPFFCPMSCNDGLTYYSCGPLDEETCSSVNSEGKKSSSSLCVEGCFCPNGMVVSPKGKCIHRDSCPCELRGKMMDSGTQVDKDCNTCTCMGGLWKCTNAACGSRCSVVGDPHYTTFDGKRYDFMGKCSYYLVKTHNFTIEAENVPCAGAISEAMNFPVSVLSAFPSCTKSVLIRSDGHVVRLRQRGEVTVDGEEVSDMPYDLISTIHIARTSSQFLTVVLSNGLEVWWDGQNRVYVDAPATLQGKLQGLCGTFNTNQKDDFTTPEGDVENSPVAFANKWKVEEKCDDLTLEDSAHPCDLNAHNKAIATEHCSKIKGDLFMSCHPYADPDPYYRDCMYDVCSCQSKKVSECLCGAVADYAKECARQRIIVDWRYHIRECGVHCPGSQTYQICGNPCTHSCATISSRPKCRKQCVEGCNCPDGFALDSVGECIPTGTCPCVHINKEYPPGHIHVRPNGKTIDVCVCSSGLWDCLPASESQLKAAEELTTKETLCRKDKNEEYTTCVDDNKVTCKTMHNSSLSKSIKSTSELCQPGCRCKKGYIYDSVAKNCVLPAHCPCHHGGRSYEEGESIQSDCNTCACEGGTWACTERICPGMCTAWGDSHYKTFDDRMYDFHGNCHYMLAKGKAGKQDSFEVLIQNVPCGTSGVTCSKSITLKVGIGEKQEEVIFTKNKPLTTSQGFERISIRHAGLYVYADVFDLGVVLQWDKGTRVYIRVDPKWRGRLKGLCGDYNGNDQDDFQTPSGGIGEASVNLFGDSWRVQKYCPHSQEIKDTCSLHPHRKAWASQQCGVLKSSVFRPCHNHVPLGPYLERCVFDSCGCDLGGDCECLCTAIAAYAHQCAIQGVPIRWRNQQLCPIQCDENCAHYNPCMSACPLDTCDSLHSSTLSRDMCSQDACVEGCQGKKCPPGQVYNNAVEMKCVPVSECKTDCMVISGVTYYEGDVLEEDACHTCHCSRGRKICQGESCPVQVVTLPTIKEEIITVTPMWMEGSCISGWSKWINNDHPVPFKKTTDKEPLPDGTNQMHLLQVPQCSRDEMRSIRCRTTGTHIDSKSTGQDVECSLNRGLVCIGKGGVKGGRVKEGGGVKGGQTSTCFDYEISVLCDCGNATTIPPLMTTTVRPIRIEVTPTPYPPNPSCIEGWSSWMNSHTPDSMGEFETVDLLRPIYSFCPDHMITQIECRQSEGLLSSDFDKHATCDVQGLRCHNYGGKSTCADYEVRVNCKCECADGLGMESGEIKDHQLSVSSYQTPGTLGEKARLNGLGSWVAGHTGAPSEQWISVSFDELKEVTGVKIQGHHIREEWVTSFIVLWSEDLKTWKGVIEEGSDEPKQFTGNTDSSSVVIALFPSPVFARGIRIVPLEHHEWISLRFEILGCGITELTTTSTTTPLPTCVEGWSDYLNVSHPTQGSGDYEVLDTLEDLGLIPCTRNLIWDIECKLYKEITRPFLEGLEEQSTELKDYHESEDIVTCKKTVGLVCNNKQQGPGKKCKDYAVRFYCGCGAPTTVSPRVTTEEEIMMNDCPYGKEWQECAFKCDHLCMHFEDQLKQQGYCEHPEDCVPGCVSTSYVLNCPKGSLWRDRDTCVSEADCTCHANNGVQVKPGQVVEESACVLCQCIHNEYLCDQSACVSATEPSVFYFTAATVASPIMGSKVCGWSRWVSTSSTSVKGSEGDFEEVDKVLHYLHKEGEDWCTKPKNIECRSVEGQMLHEATGQSVVCNAILGLHCFNFQNEPTGCLDYEVRVYCPCGGEVTVPPTPISIGIVTVPTACDSWSTWFNDHNPSQGLVEVEGMLSDELQELGFCQEGEITQVECVDSVTGLTAAEVGNRYVTCDIEHGLICTHGSQQASKTSKGGSSRCRDYKIRYYCACVSKTSTTIAIVDWSMSPPSPCDKKRFVPLFNSKENRLKDSAFKASSSISSLFGPHNSRINSFGSWTPNVNDRDQFIQVDLASPTPVYGVGISGSKISDEYVTSFYIMYSLDGLAFSYAKDVSGAPQLLYGPIKSHEFHLVAFDIPFEARYVRLSPQTWKTTISVRWELYTCGAELSTVPTTTVPPTTTPMVYIVSPVCEDEMGFMNGMMADEQVSVSSVYDGDYEDQGQSRARLDTTKEGKKQGGWIPDVNNKQQWIQFDFLELRNVTGIVTQGGDGSHAWVTTFKVIYSQDGDDWSTILDSSHNDKVFRGNVDADSRRVTYFDRVLRTQYLRVIPLSWFNYIILRVEPMGCFEPYPILTTSVPTTTVPPECHICPDIPHHLVEDCKECEGSKLWDGEECVYKVMCPCYVGLIRYDVGSAYESEDCQECVCQIGGHSVCKEKICLVQCSDNSRPVMLPLCGCVCQSCPPSTVLCPTSKTCINETSWCDGVEDCPDDEIQCVTTTHPCPDPSCPSGMQVILSEVETMNGCPMFSCENVTPAPSACPTPKCPPGYRLVRTLLPQRIQQATKGGKSSRKPSSVKGVKSRYIQQSSSSVISDCPKYKCITIPVYGQEKTTTPPPAPLVIKEATCTMEGRNFITFDGTDYKYDVCHHILATDIKNHLWNITVHKNCSLSGECTSFLMVSQDDHFVKFNSDMTVEYNDYTYSVVQTQKIGSQYKAFVISRLGDVLFFESNRYGFWVVWDAKGHTKIGVPGKLVGKISGLCGLYNNEISDDKQHPDGSAAVTTQDFGDSWSLEGPACAVKACPSHIQKTAWEACSAVRQPPFSSCADAVNTDHFISRCMEAVCACMSGSSLSEGVITQECRCSALLSFVLLCHEVVEESGDEAKDLSPWRITHKCPVECPPGEVFRECSPTPCELSCSSLMEQEPCPPLLPNLCFPGCFCPEDMVRGRDNICIHPDACRDCVCDGYGDPQYLSFDRANYTFNGNCTYVAAQDINSGGAHDFQVLVTNKECEEEPTTTCTQAVTVIYDGHVVHIRRNKSHKKIEVFVDDLQVTSFPQSLSWMKLESLPGQEATLLIPSIQLEVTYFYHNFAFSVRLPSSQYYNKTEGLCGNCNKEKADEMKQHNGEITDDVNAFGTSWLFHNPPTIVGEENGCNVPPKKECIPLHPDEDPCLRLLDTDIFGKCHLLVDPLPYLVACQFDVCHSVNKESSACRDLSAFARDCLNEGICINWRKPDLCPMDCPNGLEYSACGSGCLETCDNYQQSQQSQCQMSPVDGCYCPQGQVYKDGKCLAHEYCIHCDNEGHYYGDEWKVDNCTSCVCTGDGLLCTQETCVQKKPTCPLGQKLIMSEGTKYECCPTIICTPKSEDLCKEPIKPDCGYGQELKLQSETVCPSYVCECLPVDQCPSFSPPTLNQGEEIALNNSGCCPHADVLCNESLCPQSDQADCPHFHKLHLTKGTESYCCPEYHCEPPKDVCIYEHLYAVNASGFEHALLEHEKYAILKQPGSVWIDGLCRKCRCDKETATKGSHKYVSTCEILSCPTSQPNENYVVEMVLVPNQCCLETIRTACRELAANDEWEIHAVDSTWLSSDGNPCHRKECTLQDAGAIQVDDIQRCDHECKLGWVYKLPSSDECCGHCEPASCIADGIEHPIDSTWTSPERCSSYTCELGLNSTVSLLEKRVVCLPLDPYCPTEHVQMDETGCCQICNLTGICEPVSIPQSETTEILTLIHQDHGFCTNKGPIEGFTECDGTCQSKTVYNKASKTHESDCHCCQALSFTPLSVLVTCVDNYGYISVVMVPSTCSCLPCHENTNIEKVESN